jgi:hypothetical protein
MAANLQYDLQKLMPQLEQIDDSGDSTFFDDMVASLKANKDDIPLPPPKPPSTVNNSASFSIGEGIDDLMLFEPFFLSNLCKLVLYDFKKYLYIISQISKLFKFYARILSTIY